MIPLILIAVLVLIVILAFIAIFVSKKNKRPVDYYNFFIMGIIWTGAGIPLENFALTATGIIFMVLGLANKKKWKSNRVRWKDLSKTEKRVRIWLFIVLGLLVLAGFLLFLASS